MIRPDIDGRLALRVREVACAIKEDLHLGDGPKADTLSAVEATRILQIAADVFEEYIMAMRDYSA